MAITAAQFNALAEDVKCHDEWINGNGKPGAKIRIDRLENGFDRIDKKLDKITWYVLGIFATVTGALLIWFLTKILPAIVASTGAG